MTPPILTTAAPKGFPRSASNKQYTGAERSHMGVSEASRAGGMWHVATSGRRSCRTPPQDPHSSIATCIPGSTPANSSRAVAIQPPLLMYDTHLHARATHARRPSCTIRNSRSDRWNNHLSHTVNLVSPILILDVGYGSIRWLTTDAYGIPSLTSPVHILCQR